MGKKVDRTGKKFGKEIELFGDFVFKGDLYE